jgi:hypothetical protein
MTNFDTDNAGGTNEPDLAECGKLSREQHYQQLAWLFGLVALVELGILLKLLLEAPR